MNKSTWELRSHDKEIEQILLDDGKSRLLARLVAQRSIPKDEIDAFLDCKYSDLSHPYVLPNMEKASKVFLDVAVAKGRVLIFGDYDCDGTTSSAMLREACCALGLQTKVMLPLRQKHGYGLNDKSVDALLEIRKEFKPDILLVTDCGSSNEAEVKRLKEGGFGPIIIFDHHIIAEGKESKSAEALVNWHLGDAQEMCSCGEVFQFIRSLRIKTKKIDPASFLTYAAIGTVGDVMPLSGDNRIIVKHGLTEDAMSQVHGYGLSALVRQSKINTKNLSQYDVQFKIVPKINAAGRMTDPMIAHHLYIEQSYEKAEKIANELGRLNEQRKELQRKIEKDAIAEVEKNIDRYKYGILILNSEWYIGVIGIVAARIAEKFKKPTLVIGEQDGVWKGSGRSYNNMDLSEILKTCEHIFDGYGGHAQAAGATLKIDCLDTAYKDFDKACQVYCEKYDIKDPVSYYDAELKLETISMDTSRVLYHNLYPYGNNDNTDPIFLLSNVTIDILKVYEGKGWNLISFNAIKDGVVAPLQFKMFSSDLGGEIQGYVADVYFKFPHSDEPDSYGGYQLNVVEIVNKN